MRVSGLPRCGVSRSRFGHVVGHLAQPVHVVAERDQPRRQAGEFGERVAHPDRARHLAEGADMRQAGRAVAGLEQRVALAGRGEPLRRPWPLPRTARFSGSAVSLLRSVSGIRRKLETGGCTVNRGGAFCSAVTYRRSCRPCRRRCRRHFRRRPSQARRTAPAARRRQNSRRTQEPRQTSAVRMTAAIASVSAAATTATATVTGRGSPRPRPPAAAASRRGWRRASRTPRAPEPSRSRR